MTDFNITDRVDTVLFTDTSANLTPPLAKGISIIPLAYSIEGKEQHQDPQTGFDGHTYYERIRAGAQVSTSMINPDAFKNAFTKALSQGKDVLYIGMSGGISGTAQAAFCAAAELREQYPERTIITVDTLAASLGEGLQVLKAVQMLDGGGSLASVAEMLESATGRQFGVVMILMSVGMLSGFLILLPLGKKLCKSVDRSAAENGDSTWKNVLSGVFMLVMFSVYIPILLFTDNVQAAVMITGLVIAIGVGVLAKRPGLAWLNNFVMAFSMLGGLISSLAWVRIFG